MAFVHGKGTKFKIDTGADALTDISAYLNNVDVSWEVDTPETTTFGNSDRTYIAGLRNATISIAGIWDATLDAVIASQPAGATTLLNFEYGPAGLTGGLVKYSGTCLLTSYSLGSPVDGVATFSADYQVSGAVTVGTWS